jgi:hypothetical protein
VCATCRPRKRMTSATKKHGARALTVSTIVDGAARDLQACPHLRTASPRLCTASTSLLRHFHQKVRPIHTPNILGTSLSRPVPQRASAWRNVVLMIYPLRGKLRVLPFASSDEPFFAVKLPHPYDTCNWPRGGTRIRPLLGVSHRERGDNAGTSARAVGTAA